MRPDRITPMHSWKGLGGYSLLELTMVMGLGATLTAAAVPQYLSGLDDVRAKGAAHHLSGRLQNARTEAVKRSAMVGVQFTQTPDGTYSYAVQGIARILARQGNLDEALATLRKVEIDKLQGHWRGSMFIALAETLQAAGKKEEAFAMYKSIAGDDLVEPRFQKLAEETLGKQSK